MSDRQIYRLVHDQARQRAVQGVLSADEGMVVRISPSTRSLEQSALFHAICGDLAKQLSYCGKMRTLEQWKHLIVIAHSMASNEDSDVVPGIEGGIVDLRESTASMSVARMSSLIEYALAYCAMNGVKTNEV